MAQNLQSTYEEYEKVIDDHLRYYEKQVTDNSRWHNGLQLVVLLGSIMLPFLVGNAGMVQEAHLPLWIPIVLSLIVALAAGIDGYFKFGDTCNTFRSVCQLITREKRWYRFQIEPYQEQEKR